MAREKPVYTKTCPICNEQFETHDSRVVTDKERCQQEFKKQQARARYHRHIQGESPSGHWRRSDSPVVRIVCGHLVKCLPATKERLEKEIILLIKKHPDLGITESTLANCLVKLRFLGLARFDRDTRTWVRPVVHRKTA